MEYARRYFITFKKQVNNKTSVTLDILDEELEYIMHNNDILEFYCDGLEFITRTSNVLCIERL